MKPCEVLRHTHTRHPAVCLCELCGNTFTKASSLKKHQRTIHAKTVRFPWHCGRVFKWKANLNSHVMIVHLPDINQQLLKNSKEKQVIHSDKTYSNQYKCAGCVSGHFLRYTHTKHPPVCTCEQCGKTFTEVGDMRRHIRKNHEKTESYTCYCGKVCTNKTSLRSHYMDVHNV